ncbi:uncharacterized RNA methyltransferase pc1998 isoform X2 [Oryza brachyantha]|uniref:uncharacterized RNA methyltransferase pc1998 isoform X2 n=1 Tax=Oryza brachyantha TaxID=4533 RepID=UPI001ADB49E0|nr:uncharacterized RNA methyltransferase pc1998 isoform X2 [Oryza brachyantha]
MPPPAGLLPWPAPSATRLATPTRTRPPPRTRVRPPPPPAPAPPTKPPAPAPPPPPRLEPVARSPAAATATLPPITTSALSPSSATCLECVHFNSCSGCTHEVDLDKPAVLQEVENFFNGHGVGDFTFSRGRLREWRCRAKLAIRGTPESPLIGLYQEGTHTVADIPECRAHHPSINATIKLLRQGISELNIQPFDEDAGTGELRYVQMAVTTYNTSIPVAKRYEQGRVQVSLVWNSRDEHSQNSEKLSLLSEFLWRNGGAKGTVHLIHSIWANFQTTASNIIFGHKWRHLIGEKDLWERYGGVDISLDPYSFGQANTLSFNALLHKLHKYVPRGSTVVDLYSGAGVIGLSLAASKKCSSPTKVNDEKRPWILRAREAAVQVDSTPLEESSGTWPETLIYISCGWDSFKKDCKSLMSSKAWHLQDAHAFNFFPGTDSIEVLAIFKRESEADQKKRKKAKKKKAK